MFCVFSVVFDVKKEASKYARSLPNPKNVRFLETNLRRRIPADKREAWRNTGSSKNHWKLIFYAFERLCEREAVSDSVVTYDYWSWRQEKYTARGFGQLISMLLQDRSIRYCCSVGART